MIDSGLRGTLCNKVVLFEQFVIVVRVAFDGWGMASGPGESNRDYNYIQRAFRYKFAYHIVS